VSGIRCERETAVVGFPGEEGLSLRERRFALSVSGDRDPFRKPAADIPSHLGTCVVVVIIDPPNGGYDRKAPELSNKSNRSPGRFGLLPCGTDSGITMFQHMLCISLKMWARDWTATLRHIDKVLSIKVCPRCLFQGHTRSNQSKTGKGRCRERFQREAYVR
jgi:hypothetical protein